MNKQATKTLTSILASMSIATSIFASQISLTLENDTFAIGRGKGDHDYTHGTGIEFVDNSFWHYKIGQNMYAPSDLRRSDHIEGDRPYAGLIYGGVGYDFFREKNLYWTHYGEIDFGMIGPAAMCKDTQTMVHKLLNCRKPMGWDNQLHNEFVVNAQWWEKYNYYICDYVALVPRAGILAGTIQDAIEVGCDLKVGWNLKNDVGNNMMFSSSRSLQKKSFFDKLCAYGYVGADERYYLYNHILEGSMFGHKDHGLDVDIEPFVAELQCGFGIEYGNFMFRYYMTFRQKEFEGQKHWPDYAGLVFGWSW